MTTKPHYLKIIRLWLAWAIILVAYQAIVQARFSLERPDTVLNWTANETKRTSHKNQPYLLEPFLNSHVAWDSEYYLSIAVGGYADPAMRAIPADYTWEAPRLCGPNESGPCYSMNYAFFPFYPLATRVLSFPLKVLGLTPIATATLSGVCVSLLGALMAALALYDFTRQELGDSGGWRAAFYLLIFPSAFFLAQIYTEGLFIGLTFGALAMLRRRQWILAALLAVCATWTRAAGGLLVIPFLFTWLAEMQGLSAADESSWLKNFREGLEWHFSWKMIGRLLLALSPVWAYLVWRVALGGPFGIVEERFFSRGLLAVGQSIEAWGQAVFSLFGENPQTRVYYSLEFAAILFALFACIRTWGRYPAISLFGIAVILFSLSSGVAQGMHRYILAAPSVFIVLGRWGEKEVFDRAWSVASILLMGLLAALFTFDFWTG